LGAALAWSISVPGNAEMSLHLALALDWFYSWELAPVFYERVLAYARVQGGYAAETLAQTLHNLGGKLALTGNYAAGEERFESSVKLFRELDDRRSLAAALERWGWVAREQGNSRAAIARFQEALALARDLADDRLTSAISNSLAAALTMQGDTVGAKSLLGQNLIVARKNKDVPTIGWTLNHLGHVAQVEGNYQEGKRLHIESMVQFREMGSGYTGTPEALHSLGETELAQGDTISAAMHLSESLILSRELGYRTGVAWCLAGLAGAAVLNEEPERAASLWGAAEQLRSMLGAREGPATHATHERLMAQARAQLGDAAFDAAWAQGAATQLQQVLDDVLGGRNR
jgi:tetratricopeptide (TPR) repeat protein